MTYRLFLLLLAAQPAPLEKSLAEVKSAADLHAVVGLDLERRAEAEAILARRLRAETDRGERYRQAAKLLDLGGLSPGLLREAAGALAWEPLGLLGPDGDDRRFSRWTRLKELLPVPEAEAAAKIAILELIRRYEPKTNEARNLWNETQFMPAFLPHLDRASRAALGSRVVERLLEAIPRLRAQGDAEILCERLALVARAVEGSLDPALVRRASERILAELEQEADPHAILALASHLGGLCRGLPREEAVQLGSAVRPRVVQAAGKMTRTLRVNSPLSQWFPEIVGTWSDDDARPACAAVADRLFDLIPNERWAVLDLLAVRYDRPFYDLWDFVRFARTQKLDLTGPMR